MNAAAPKNAPGVIPVEAVERWIAIAEPKARLTYYSGQRLPQSDPTIAYLRTLSDDGEILFSSAPREGLPGRDYLAIRCEHPDPDPRFGLADDVRLRPCRRKSPLDQDSDRAAVFAAIERAADLGTVCPSNTKLAELAGLDTRYQAAAHIRALKEAGTIQSKNIEERPRKADRRILIVATGKWTA